MRSRRRRGLGGVFFVDFPTLLLSIFAALFILTEAPTRKPPTIDTPGVLAITDSWAAHSNNDIDIYVRDPVGNVVYFADTSEGLMHLEQDDLGAAVTGMQTLPNGRVVRATYNGERVVLTGAVPGEYVVNIQVQPERSRHDSGARAAVDAARRRRGARTAPPDDGQ